MFDNNNNRSSTSDDPGNGFTPPSDIDPQQERETDQPQSLTPQTQRNVRRVRRLFIGLVVFGLVLGGIVAWGVVAIIDRWILLPEDAPTPREQPSQIQ